MSSISSTSASSASTTQMAADPKPDLPLYHAKIQKASKHPRHYVWLPMSIVNHPDYMLRPGDVVEIIVDKENASITLMLYQPAEDIERRKKEKEKLTERLKGYRWTD